MVAKRILMAAGVTVAAYVATSWALGRAAHARFDIVEQQLAQQPLSLVKIAERSYTPGVFSSTEVVTFEFDRELWKAMTRRSNAPTDEFEIDEEASEEEGASPLRLTVRNEMRHGPLPGFTSFGIARIRSTLVLNEGLRAKVTEILGDREPLVIDTLVG